jgi:hypothetical protein
MTYVSRKVTERTQQALQAQDRLVFTPLGMVPRWFGAIFLVAGIASVAVGVSDVLGMVHGEGTVGAVFLVGGSFALVGYGLTFYRSRLEFDLTLRRWRQEQGVPPWSKVREGALSDWNHVRFDREMRTVSTEGGTTTYPVWALQLRAADNHFPPLTVTGFDFPCQQIGRMEALALAATLAQKLNLPLREEDAEEFTPLSPVPSALLSRPSLAVISPPPSSRIGYETLPDGTVSITLSGSPQKAFPALLPLGGVVAFIWQAEQSHRDFLAHVPADSRAFFTRGPSPMVFFSPMLLFAGLPFLIVLAYHLTRRHIRITPEQVNVFSTLFDKPFGQRSVARRSLRGVQFPPGTATTGSVSVNGISAGSRSQSGRDIVLVSDQTDLRIGGNLPPAERAWLEQTLFALLSPAPL